MERRGEHPMMPPEQFYDDTETPSRQAKARMWRRIKREAGWHGIRSFFITDVRSFAWGMAATVVLYFASVGAYTTARQAMQNSQPAAVQLDAAYQSAIQDLEKGVQRVLAKTDAGPNELNYLS